MTSLPDLPLHLELADGRRLDVVVSGLRPATTVAELATLASPDAVPLVMALDGVPVGAAERVGELPVRTGSTLSWAPRDAAAPDAVVVARAVTGPDWGRATPLPAGRHVVGRAPGCRVMIADRSVAPRHAVLTIGPDGRADVEEFGVGRPIEIGAAVVQIGSTSLILEPPALPGDRAGDGHRSTARTRGAGPMWLRPVIRPARSAPVESPVIRRPVVPSAPDRLPTGLGFVSAVVAVLGGVVAGLVLGQPTMILLSVLGAAGAATTVGVQAVRDRRTRSANARIAAAEHERFGRELDLASESMRGSLEARAPWTVGTEVTVERLWEHRLRAGAGWAPVLGVGTLEWTPPVEGEAAAGEPVRLEGVGVPVELASGSVVAVCGEPDDVDRVVRSLVLQAACRYGPADLRIVEVSGDGRAMGSWDATPWSAWLPHLEADLAPGDASDDRTTLFVVDGPDALAVRTSPVRRRLDSGSSSAWTLVACRDDQVVPQVCSHVVRVHGATGTAELHHVTPPAEATFAVAGSIQRMTSCGVGAETAGRVARALAGRSDPEAPTTAASLPDEVAIDDLPAGRTDAVRLAVAWAAAGPDPAPVAVLGRAVDGLVELDLHRDGPHALVAGTTGAGKSELLRSLVLGLAMSSPPDLLQFVLVDYKGGSAFDRCASLPHVAGSVTDLDDRLAARMLASFDAELKRRERVLREHRSGDLSDFRRAGGSGIPRLVVVIDEFAALAAELPEFLSSLVAIAQRGRSLGVHLVLATQRPSGVVDDDIRANTNIRLCLRVQDHGDALDVIGDRRAADLPRTRPGRAMLRLGGDAPMTFQTARCTGSAGVEQRGLRMRPLRTGDPVPSGEPGPTSLAVLADVLADASTIRDRSVPIRTAPLWTEPLPAMLDLSDDTSIGSIDDVRGQRRLPLVRVPGAGHLVVAGARGAGVSTALGRVATALAAASPPDELHLFVVDGAGSGTLAPLVALPHCGGIVAADDDERLTRLVTLLERTVDRAGSAGRAGTRVTTLVVIDDAGALRTRLAAPEMSELADRVARVVAEGPAAGVEMLFGIDHCAALPMSWITRCSDRWIGRLADPLDAASLGLPPSAALRTSPAGRFVVGVTDGQPLDAQIAGPSEPLADRCGRIAGRWSGTPSTVATVGAAPVMVRREALPPGHRPDATSGGQDAVALPVGVHAVTLDPLGLVLHRGDHGLVLGPSRSGRTSVLRLLAEAWAELYGPELVTVLSGRSGASRPSTISDVEPAEGARRLVLVDDAERYSDADGALTRLLTDDRGEVHVVAAGRPDALRSAGYAHWTAALRRPSWGLLLGQLHDTDADLLGANVSRRHLRRSPSPAGRGLLVVEGQVSPVQMAWTPPVEVQR